MTSDLTAVATTGFRTRVLPDGSQKLRSSASGVLRPTSFGVAHVSGSLRSAMSEKRVTSAATSSGAAPRASVPVQCSPTLAAVGHQAATALTATSGQSGAAAASTLVPAAVVLAAGRQAMRRLERQRPRDAGMDGRLEVPSTRTSAGRAGRADLPGPSVSGAAVRGQGDCVASGSYADLSHGGLPE
jgi:hypothetical protein